MVSIAAPKYLSIKAAAVFTALICNSRKAPILYYIDKLIRWFIDDFGKSEREKVSLSVAPAPSSSKHLTDLAVPCSAVCQGKLVLQCSEWNSGANSCGTAAGGGVLCALLSNKPPTGIDCRSVCTPACLLVIWRFLDTHCQNVATTMAQLFWCALCRSYHPHQVGSSCRPYSVSSGTTLSGSPGQQGCVSSFHSL